MGHKRGRREGLTWNCDCRFEFNELLFSHWYAISTLQTHESTTAIPIRTTDVVGQSAQLGTQEVYAFETPLVLREIGVGGTEMAAAAEIHKAVEETIAVKPESFNGTNCSPLFLCCSNPFFQLQLKQQPPFRPMKFWPKMSSFFCFTYSPRQIVRACQLHAPVYFQFNPFLHGRMDNFNLNTLELFAEEVCKCDFIGTIEQ